MNPVAWSAGQAPLNCVQDLIERGRAQKDCKRGLLFLILCSWGKKKEENNVLIPRWPRGSRYHKIWTYVSYKNAKQLPAARAIILFTLLWFRVSFLEVSSVLGKIKSCRRLPKASQACDFAVMLTRPELSSIIEKLRVGSHRVTVMSFVYCTFISLSWPGGDLWSRRMDVCLPDVKPSLRPRVYFLRSAIISCHAAKSLWAADAS